jgi:dCMP deaminase
MNKDNAVGAAMALIMGRVAVPLQHDQEVILDALKRTWTEGYIHMQDAQGRIPDPDIPPVNIPDVDTWGLSIASAVSSMGECSRRQVGSVIVSLDRRILGAGWNHSAFPAMSCLIGDCPRATSDVESNVASYDQGPGTCIAVHAEAAAILASPRGRLLHASLYSTCKPCYNCDKLISAAGIGRVIWPGKGSDATSNS